MEGRGVITSSPSQPLQSELARTLPAGASPEFSASSPPVKQPVGSPSAKTPTGSPPHRGPSTASSSHQQQPRRHASSSSSESWVRSTTVSSRLRHVSNHPVATVPVDVAALSALPSRERVLLEASLRHSARVQAEERLERERREKASFGKLQATRRALQECAATLRAQEVLERSQLRQNRAAVRRLEQGHAPPSSLSSLQQSPWARAPDNLRDQFLLWNKEKNMPPFIVTPAHCDRAPPVGTYEHSTSIQLSPVEAIRSVTPRPGRTPSRSLTQHVDPSCDLGAPTSSSQTP